jgi:hypothetical protein
MKKFISGVLSFFSDVLKFLRVPLITSVITIGGFVLLDKYLNLHDGCCNKEKNIEKEKKIIKPDPWNAICKLQFSRAYCSGTIIGPSQRSDKRWYVISAAHCVSHVNENVVIMTRNGITLRGKVILIDKKSDCTVILTEPIFDEDKISLPFAYLSDKNPKPGTKVYHGGYGVHIPGNREDGYVYSEENSDGQVCYVLSVSQGDSGGGILDAETNHLLSPVCCTTRLNGPGYVWGASPRVINKLLSQPTTFFPGPVEDLGENIQIDENVIKKFFEFPPNDMPIRKI